MSHISPFNILKMLKLMVLMNANEWLLLNLLHRRYGDRTPKSITARVFAMMSILMGITIFSMYTATLTSALSSNVDYSEIDSMVGRKVGVMLLLRHETGAIWASNKTVARR